MLLDYDFLLLLNDESGNPTRYYYCYKILKRILWLVKWLKIKRGNSLRKSLGARKSLKLKTAPLKFLTRKLLLLRAKRLEVVILKRRVRKSKAHYPLGLSQPLNPLKTLFTEISIIMSKNY